MIGCYGSLGADAQPTEAILGLGGAPSRRRNEGLGVEPPVLKSFNFLGKNNLIFMPI